MKNCSSCSSCITFCEECYLNNRTQRKYPMKEDEKEEEEEEEEEENNSK